MGLTALVLPVLTSGSSQISFAGGISSSKLVNVLNLDLVRLHSPGSTLVFASLDERQHSDQLCWRYL